MLMGVSGPWSSGTRGLMTERLRPTARGSPRSRWRTRRPAGSRGPDLDLAMLKIDIDRDVSAQRIATALCAAPVACRTENISAHNPPQEAPHLRLAWQFASRRWRVGPDQRPEYEVACRCQSRDGRSWLERVRRNQPGGRQRVALSHSSAPMAVDEAGRPEGPTTATMTTSAISMISSWVRTAVWRRS